MNGAYLLECDPPKQLHHIKAPPQLISLYTSGVFGPHGLRQGYRQPEAGAELHSTGECGGCGQEGLCPSDQSQQGTLRGEGMLW